MVAVMWLIPERRIENLRREKSKQHRGGTFFKTWPGPFCPPRSGGFDSRGIGAVPACHL
jgi:hypothetical protein